MADENYEVNENTKLKPSYNKYNIESSDYHIKYLLQVDQLIHLSPGTRLSIGENS